MDLLSMAYSFNAWEAFVKIELGENFVFPKTPDKWTAAWVLHPGPGKIEKIEGIPTIKTLPSFHSKKIKCKVGDESQIREGLGNEVGHIIFQTKSKTQLLTDLTNAQKSLHIQMRYT